MGKSGKHVAKRTDVPRSEDEGAAWKRAAKRAGFDSVTSWIRACLNSECARLGVRVHSRLDGEEE